MSFKKQNVLTELKMSLRSGGEIDDNFANFRIDECMKKLFVEGQLLSLSRYIDPRGGLKVQPISVDGSEVILNNAPTGGDFVKHTNLYEVIWDTSSINSTADYITENVKTRKLIKPSRYYIGQDVAGSSEEKIIFNEDYKSTGAYTLELWSFFSSTEEGHVQSSFSRDFYDALLSDVKYYFLLQQGRPWFDNNLALLEFRNYNEALRKLKINSNKNFTRRETKAKPANGFI